MRWKKQRMGLCLRLFLMRLGVISWMRTSLYQGTLIFTFGFIRVGDKW